MKEPNCEEMLMAQLATADGEQLPEHAAAHIAACANCQQQLQQLETLDQMLMSQTLSEPAVDLWPAIENRIAPSQRAAVSWKPFALIGLLLVIYKLVEMLPVRDPSHALKIVPLVIVVLLFVLIRENPFRINTELVMER